MSIAVDQTRLRRIVETLLPRGTLDRPEALTMMEFVQLAAGADHEEKPSEHAILQSIAQHIGHLVGLEPDEVMSIPPIDDERARAHWLGVLGSRLPSQDARELTYAFAFLVTVADLALVAREHATLEEFQRALGLSDRRATDLVVFLGELVAAPDFGPISRDAASTSA